MNMIVIHDEKCNGELRFWKQVDVWRSQRRNNEQNLHYASAADKL